MPSLRRAAGKKIGEQYIGTLCELQDEFTPLIRADIDADRTLASVEHLPEERETSRARRDAPGGQSADGVGTLGMLHFDDIGPPIR